MTTSLVKRMAFTALCLVPVAGCGTIETANLNGMFEPSIVTDAKQRVITNIDIVNNSVAGQVLPKRIVCAEPSPDVTSAFSEAIQASVSKTDKDGKKTGAHFGRSTAESLAQLGERLASIQLLRDMAYRNCEAYANGSINATSYTILNSRLNKTVVTLLASEMIMGAFGRTLATASASASTQSGNDGSTTTAQTNVPPAATTPGKIEGRNVTAGVAELGKIHKRFIEDDSFVTLIDACVAHLNTIPVIASDVDKGITREDVKKARDDIKKSIFTELCKDSIIPAAVEIAKRT